MQKAETTQDGLTPWERKLEADYRKLMAVWGKYESIQRLVRKISKPSTRVSYLFMLQQYFRWLRDAKGVTMDPDALILDNLKAVYESSATDVKRKRTHTDWLDMYVNDYLLAKGVGSKRVSTAAAVRMFYKRNDASLVGDFSVADGQVPTPDAALPAEDIRKVLLALPLGVRLPLLMEWQSAVEVNRLLSLRWGRVAKMWEEECPLKLVFHGRKRHRKSFHTYLGRDSIEGLKAWHGEWVRLFGRQPQDEDLIFPGKRGTGLDHGWLNDRIKVVARNLNAEGMIKNGAPGSWRTHMLRASFKTEAEHAGVKSSIVEFFMGHDRGIEEVYDRRDELHETDFVESYRKIEPFVSLDYNEAIASEENKQSAKQMLELITSLQRRISSLESRGQAASDARAPPQSR